MSESRIDLLALVSAQREAMLAGGPEAADAIEAASCAVEGAIRAIRSGALPPPSPAQAKALGAALERNRVVLNRLRAVNQRSVKALFGDLETPLYAREG